MPSAVVLQTSTELALQHLETGERSVEKLWIDVEIPRMKL